MRTVVFVAALCMLLSSCGGGSLVYEGRRRHYLLHVPDAVRSQPGRHVALVVALHGGFGTGATFAYTTSFSRLADREDFVVVYPDGLARAWNAGRCCGRPAEERVDDVGFVAALVADVEHRFPIDPRRVFAAGISNGAMMAWRLACERADLFAAVVVVAGSLETTTPCRPARPVSVLVVHGAADRSHPIDGGRGALSLGGPAFRSLNESIAMWTTANDCGDPSPQIRQSRSVERTVWQCAERTETVRVVIDGGHSWPGGHLDPLTELLVGAPSHAIDATRASWDFFTTHARVAQPRTPLHSRGASRSVIGSTPGDMSRDQLVFYPDS